MKPGHAAKIDLRMIFEAAFGECKEEDGWLKGATGCMPRIWVRQEGKKAVVVDTETDKSFALRMAQGDEEAARVVRDTHQAWNDFLEGVTGYDAKKRSKKVQEAVKKAS